VVRLPVANLPLDVFRRGQLPFQDLAHEARQLLVARESEGDQLTGPDLRDPCLPFRGQETLEPEAHFEADEAVLDGQRKVRM